MSEMDLGMLVRQAAVSGVTLWVEEGQLRFKAPEGKLTTVLRAALQSRKSELIGKLSVPVFRKRAAPSGPARFPACSRGFWEESEANTAFRHSTHFAVRIFGKIQPERIDPAFERLIARHDLLRSKVVVVDDGMPVLQVDDEPPAPVQIVDLSEAAAEERAPQVKDAVERAIYTPFEEGRIYRARVIKVSACEHVLAVVMHHFVADAVALEVVAGELLAGILGGRNSQSQTGERPLQYADYLLGMNEWLAGQGLQYRLGLWKERMRGAQGVQFPLADQSQVSGPRKLDVLDIPVGSALRAKLAGAVASAGVPLFAAILAANFEALAITFQRRDFFTMLVHSGRKESLLFDLVGFTVNCLPVRVSVAPRMSYIDLMVHVHEAFVFARDHEVPWGILMPMLKDIDASYVAPLFNYRFVARDATSAPASSARGGIGIEPVTVEGPEQSNSVDWKSYELHALDSGVDMRVILKYMPFAYQTTALKEFAHTFMRCLEALAEDPRAHLLH